MSDLVERLRRWGRTRELECVPPEKLMDEAADELERMTAMYDNRGIMISDRNKWLAEKDTRIAELEVALRKINSDELYNEAQMAMIAEAALEQLDND